MPYELPRKLTALCWCVAKRCHSAHPCPLPPNPQHSDRECLGAQATMVGTWLLELYLDQLNRSLLEVKGNAEPWPTGPESNGHGQRATDGTEGSSKKTPAPDQLTQDLRAFLKRNVDVLDVNVTVSLLAGYGRLDDLMEYATYRKVSCQLPTELALLLLLA